MYHPFLTGFLIIGLLFTASRILAAPGAPLFERSLLPDVPREVFPVSGRENNDPPLRSPVSSLVHDLSGLKGGGTGDAATIRNLERRLRELDAAAAGMPPGARQARENRLEALSWHFRLAAIRQRLEEDRYEILWQRGGRMPKGERNLRGTGPLWAGLLARLDARDYIPVPAKRSTRYLLLFRAYALLYQGRLRAMKKPLTLLRASPLPAIQGDALALQGEALYLRRAWTKAARSFLAARRIQSSPLYLWSLYRLAMIRHHQGRFAAAWKFWQEATRDSLFLPRDAPMKKAMQRGMVTTAASLKSVQPVLRFYTVSTLLGPEFLTELAEALRAKGNTSAALTVIDHQLQRPGSAMARHALLMQRVRLLFNAGRYPAAWQQMTVLLKQAAPPKRSGSGMTPGGSGPHAQVENLLYNLAGSAYRRAVQSNDAVLFREARHGYRLYLHWFPATARAPGAGFFLAVLDAWHTDFLTATQGFRHIVSQGRGKTRLPGRKGRRGRDLYEPALLGMLMSATDGARDALALLEQRAAAGRPVAEMPVAGQSLINACTTWQRIHPAPGRRSLACESTAARLWLATTQKQKAVRWLTRTALRYPNHKSGPDAVRRLLPLLQGRSLRSMKRRLLSIRAYRRGNTASWIRAYRPGRTLPTAAP